MQQNLFEYEKTLNELDEIFRRDDSKDEIIFELKNVIDQQLKKIVKSQQDYDALLRQKPDKRIGNSGQDDLIEQLK